MDSAFILLLTFYYLFFTFIFIINILFTPGSSVIIGTRSTEKSQSKFGVHLGKQGRNYKVGLLHINLEY